MNTTILIVIIAIAVVIVAALVAMAVRRQRTTALREHFGPEYDRTVESAEDRRAAEQALRQREKERSSLDIRPLSEAARARYAQEWRDLQARFVDEPSPSVEAAGGLLDRVMNDRGYPVDDFENQADLVSVDHPDVVENYRLAHRVHVENRAKRASTEALREALLRYRSLFDELLRADDDVSSAAESRDSAPRERSTERRF